MKMLPIILLLAISHQSYGQDIHYSQFYSSALTLNPALTGLFLGQHRIGINYKSQWKSANAQFITNSISYDTDLYAKKINNQDIFGAGILINNDKAGIESGLNLFNGTISSAYHKTLNKNSKIALGLQASFMNKSIFGGLTYPNNWDKDQGFVEAIGWDPSDQSSFSYIDFNTGLFWYLFPGGGNSSIFAGGSIFHLFTPRETFINTGDNRISRRYIVHGGVRLNTNSNLNFIPNILFMRQGSSEELNFGTTLELDVPEMFSTMSIGFWYRNQDALIVVLGMDYVNLHFGISYDINISDLQESSRYKGGIELSLSYIFKSSITHDLGTHPCPRH